MAGSVYRPAHGGDVAVVACRAVVVGQRLLELTAVNSRQPAADVVGESRRMDSASHLLALQPAQVVVGVFCKGHGGAAVQLVLHLAQAVGVVVAVGGDFGQVVRYVYENPCLYAMV